MNLNSMTFLFIEFYTYTETFSVIRLLPFGNPFHNTLWFVYIFVTIIFGKHKLFPYLSPNFLYILFQSLFAPFPLRTIDRSLSNCCDKGRQYAFHLLHGVLTVLDRFL